MTTIRSRMPVGAPRACCLAGAWLGDGLPVSVDCWFDRRERLSMGFTRAFPALSQLQAALGASGEAWRVRVCGGCAVVSGPGQDGSALAVALSDVVEPMALGLPVVTPQFYAFVVENMGSSSFAMLTNPSCPCHMQSGFGGPGSQVLVTPEGYHGVAFFRDGLPVGTVSYVEFQEAVLAVLGDLTAGPYDVDLAYALSVPVAYRLEAMLTCGPAPSEKAVASFLKGLPFPWPAAPESQRLELYPSQVVVAGQLGVDDVCRGGAEFPLVELAVVDAAYEEDYMMQAGLADLVREKSTLCDTLREDLLGMFGFDLSMSSVGHDGGAVVPPDEVVAWVDAAGKGFPRPHPESVVLTRVRLTPTLPVSVTRYREYFTAAWRVRLFGSCAHAEMLVSVGVGDRLVVGGTGTVSVDEGPDLSGVIVYEVAERPGTLKLEVKGETQVVVYTPRLLPYPVGSGFPAAVTKVQSGGGTSYPAGGFDELVPVLVPGHRGLVFIEAGERAAKWGEFSSPGVERTGFAGFPLRGPDIARWLEGRCDLGNDWSMFDGRQDEIDEIMKVFAECIAGGRWNRVADLD